MPLHHPHRSRALRRSRRRRLSGCRTPQPAVHGGDRLLALVSHEMREPLNAVLGMGRLLAQTPLAPEQREYLDAVLTAADGLLTLVNDLLDLARLESGRIELAETRFSLRIFLDRLTAPFALRARERGLTFEVRQAEGLPDELLGDPARLRQIVTNLLSNALKYTERGGIRLEVDAEHKWLRICVRDTGLGIRPADLVRLFTPWERGVGEARRRAPGSGLGLVIARQLARAMGGDLRLESRVGKGTCAELRIPLRAAPPLAEEVDSESDLNGRRLLLVGFDARERQRLRRLAARWGMSVATATSGSAALARLRAAAARGTLFDVALVTSELEDLEPGAFARAIRREPALAPMRLVLLAVLGLRGEAGDAWRAGYDAFLAAPAPAETLHACLLRLRSGRPDRLLTAHDLAERASRKLRILVADDNPLNARLLTVLLERAGHTVHCVENGARALEALEAEPFDLVLLDVQMPELDGVETVRRIRALPDPAKARIPVIAVTADVLRADRNRYLAAGMDSCLGKPVDPERLFAEIGRYAAAAPSGKMIFSLDG